MPEDIDAMRELLQYGLQGTDLEALIAIGKGEDGGRLVQMVFLSWGQVGWWTVGTSGLIFMGRGVEAGHRWSYCHGERWAW